MPTPTFEKIAEVSPSGASSVNFTSIPSTYTDLMIVASGTLSSTQYLMMYMNNKQQVRYVSELLSGIGSGSPTGVYFDTTTQWYLSFNAKWNSTSQGQMYVHIFDYTNTANMKYCFARTGAANTGVEMASLRANYTEAITSLTIIPFDGTYGSDSKFVLYGIVS